MEGREGEVSHYERREGEWREEEQVMSQKFLPEACIAGAKRFAASGRDKRQDRSTLPGRLTLAVS